MSVKVHEPVCLDSAQDLYFWFDHFLGDQVKNEWLINTTGSIVVVDAQTGGIIRSTTGAVSGNSSTIDWGDIRSLLVTKKATMEVRAKLNQATYIEAFLFLRFDGNNFITFTMFENAGGATNWFIYCRDGGVPTNLNSGIAVDTNYHIFRIECHTHGSNHVHFYIDGVETANSPITTNVPDDAADYLQPRLSVTARENLAKSMDIDYCVVRQER